MARKKLLDTEKKISLTVTINPEVAAKVDELYSNKSKYIEWLIYQDLVKNNKMESGMIL